ALFLASLVPVRPAVWRSSGPRRRRRRRLLRVSAWESVVVLARAPERLSVPVRAGHGRSGSRPPCAAVAVHPARYRRRTAEGQPRRSRRRGSGGRALHDPATSATVCPL